MRPVKSDKKIRNAHSNAFLLYWNCSFLSMSMVLCVAGWINTDIPFFFANDSPFMNGIECCKSRKCKRIKWNGTHTQKMAQRNYPYNKNIAHISHLVLTYCVMCVIYENFVGNSSASIRPLSAVCHPIRQEFQRISSILSSIEQMKRP